MSNEKTEIAAATDANSQYLMFTIGADSFALPLLKVKEIIEYEVVTRVPSMPEWVQGVINLRGNIVPVIDLAVKFRQPATKALKETCIVIVDAEFGDQTLVMGVVVDSVSDVATWSASDIQAPPSFGTRLKSDYLRGMAAAGKTFCLILDVDRVLSIDELLELAPVDADSVQECHESSLEAVEAGVN